MSEPTDRPEPEAILSELKRASRGRLKIFLGAAPGVGKTYAMLEATQRRLKEKTDLIVGILETHGRAETELLLDGLEVLPRKQIVYRDRIFYEMDIDGILKRRPRLAIVDELAHTNVPGSRHVKRHQDVEEILGAGIDVYTTLNIQHVESLNDIIARIARIRVRETVPDSVLDQADEIEVIDLSPEDLIKRLHEGKVYVPQQAERAVRHFFSTGNLTALRELALRRTAQRVDEQLLSHMREHAIPGPWPAGERVLVCISEAPNTGGLIRYARRVADRQQVPWTAIYVETARTQRLTNADRDRIADFLRLAERLLASPITLPSRNIPDDLVAYATENNITQIVIGKSSRPRWFEMVHGSVVHELVRKTGPISVHVISPDDSDSVPPKSVQTRPKIEPIGIECYLGSAVAVAVALGIGLLLKQFLAVQSISLV